MSYIDKVINMDKDNNLTDFEMQLFLHKNRVILYDEKSDNAVNNELLAVNAINSGYEWNEEHEVWIKDSCNGSITNNILINEMARYISSSQGGRCILCHNSQRNITYDGINNGCDGNCYHKKLTKEQEITEIIKWFISGIKSTKK